MGVFGPVERVHIWPTKEGAIVGKQLRDSEEFRLDVWLKDRKLRLEGIMQPNFPSHIASRLCCVNVRCGTSMPALRVSRSVKEFAEGCRSEEHTSELQSLMRISYAVFCLKKKNTITTIQ